MKISLPSTFLIVVIRLNIDEVLGGKAHGAGQVVAVADGGFECGLSLTGRVELMTQLLHVGQLSPAEITLDRVLIHHQMPE